MSGNLIILENNFKVELYKKDKILDEKEQELKLFKTKFLQLGRERFFYLSKLKDLEYLFNERNKLVYDGELKDLVNKIIYAKNEIKIEIDNHLDVSSKDYRK